MLFGTLVAALKPLFGVKSIQRGTISITSTNTSNTATINAVATANCMIRFLGLSANNNADNQGAGSSAYIALTDSTTVTATRAAPSNAATTVAAFEIIELYSVG